jgi:hypothetical protein
MAVVAAITMSMSAYAEDMPQGHSPGSPIQHGKYCWNLTDNAGHGWWDQCDTTLSFPRAKSQNLSVLSGNGDGGGGGGGGGR